jgi:hypothetical protein
MFGQGYELVAKAQNVDQIVKGYRDWRRVRCLGFGNSHSLLDMAGRVPLLSVGLWRGTTAVHSALHLHPGRETTVRICVNPHRMFSVRYISAEVVGVEKQNRTLRISVLLEIPPVDSAQKAVHVQIVKDIKERKK